MSFNIDAVIEPGLLVINLTAVIEGILLVKSLAKNPTTIKLVKLNPIVNKSLTVNPSDFNLATVYVIKLNTFLISFTEYPAPFKSDAV